MKRKVQHKCLSSSAQMKEEQELQKFLGNEKKLIVSGCSFTTKDYVSSTYPDIDTSYQMN